MVRTLGKGLMGLAIGALLGCGGGGAGPAQNTDSTLASGLKPEGYLLKWSDDFSQPGPLGAAWAYDLGEANFGGSNWGNSESQYYTNDAANVVVENDTLVIQPLAGQPAGVSLQFNNILATSARVTTNTPIFYEALANQPYGFYEVKARVPCVEGAWPAIWMLGKTGDWPQRGELDIMEWFGAYFANQPNQVQSAYHTAAASGRNAVYAKLPLPGLCQDFHRFQLLWEVNKLTFAVDDKPILVYNKPNNATPTTWPFDQTAYLLLNVAIGGTNGGPVDVATIPNMRMTVDYVKVWQPPS